MRNQSAKRILDIAVVCLLGFGLLPVLAIVAIAVFIDSGLPVLYWSRRVGKNGVLFEMVKFWTTSRDAPELASDEITASDSTSPFGLALRKYSLYELPQLYNVVKGELSMVGPRPSPPRQTELNRLREEQGVSKLVPGLTGWAQVNGRDNLTDQEKVALDVFYMERQSLILDLRILLMTGLRVVTATNVREPSTSPSCKTREQSANTSDRTSFGPKYGPRSLHLVNKRTRSD